MAPSLSSRCHPPSRSWIWHPETRFDHVRRLLSLEMANKKEKLKFKQEQLMNKIVANPEDTTSLEAQIVTLTVKIRNYEEHVQKHRNDKHYLLMSIDQRKKMLKTPIRPTTVSLRNHARSWRLSTPFPLCTTRKATSTGQPRRPCAFGFSRRYKSSRSTKGP